MSSDISIPPLLTELGLGQWAQALHCLEASGPFPVSAPSHSWLGGPEE